MKNIVNVVNFVRGIEPRPNRDIDLVGTVINQIDYLNKYSLPATFLLQYDAIIDPSFVSLLKDSRFELGLWLEVVQPQVEAIGEKWRGRFPWDWHNDVGFLIGYEKKVRLRLIDEHMNKFHEIFGYYPKSVGSWHIDAVSLKYLAEKYKIDASCNCRDQVGTDGYTMQGGYYNGAYYPSDNNMFCPAGDATQIDIPVFRMLGSDAIYCYDFQVKKDDYGIYNIPTLEPASREYGSAPWWIDSFFRTTFCGHGLSHQYTQAGQENSFGWQRLGAGYAYQMKKIRELWDENKVEVMTLGDAGRWYKNSFKTTPPQTLTALDDIINDRYKSVWYNSRFYRANIFWDSGQVRIRDLYIFNDELKELYLDTPCTTTACEFRNCPVIDGTLYGKDSGAYLTDRVWESFDYAEKDGTAVITLKSADGRCVITLDEKTISIQSDIDGFEIIPRYDKTLVYNKPTDSTELFCSRNNASTVISSIEKVSVTNTDIDFVFQGVTYGIHADCGAFTQNLTLKPQNNKITVSIK